MAIIYDGTDPFKKRVATMLSESEGIVESITSSLSSAEAKVNSMEKVNTSMSHDMSLISSQNGSMTSEVNSLKAYDQSMSSANSNAISSLATADSSMSTSLSVHNSRLDSLSMADVSTSESFASVSASLSDIGSNIDSLTEAVSNAGSIGRNYFKNSANMARISIKMPSATFAYTLSIVKSSDSLSGQVMKLTSTSNNGLSAYFDYSNFNQLRCVTGDKITFSAYIKSDVAFTTAGIKFQAISGSPRISVTTEWQRIEISGEATKDLTEGGNWGNTNIMFSIGNPIPQGKSLYIACPKLELGEKATDWNLAGEDFGNEMSTVESETSSLNTRISQLESMVNSLASK